MDQAFPSDLTDGQWKLIEPLLPKARTGGRPRTTSLRDVINAVFYLNRTGCQWRYPPALSRLGKPSTITIVGGS